MGGHLASQASAPTSERRVIIKPPMSGFMLAKFSALCPALAWDRCLSSLVESFDRVGGGHQSAWGKLPGAWRERAPLLHRDGGREGGIDP